MGPLISFMVAQVGRQNAWVQHLVVPCCHFVCHFVLLQRFLHNYWSDLVRQLREKDEAPWHFSHRSCFQVANCRVDCFWPLVVLNGLWLGNKSHNYSLMILFALKSICVYIYICSQSIWILVYNSGSFNDVYVTCYVAMRKPCRPSRLADRNWLKTGSKLETLLRRVEMHSKEPRGSFVFSNHSMYFAMCRAPICAYSQAFPPLLATRCCEQNSRTCGLWFQPCLYDTVLLGPCRTIGPMSLRFFPDSKSADGRKLPKQRATVVTVAIVYVWIWDWAWDTCFVAVCGS